MKRKNTVMIAAAALLLASLACNLGGSPGAAPAGPQPAEQAEEGEAPQVEEQEDSGGIFQPQPESAEPDQALPVAINDGLASLNSYRLTTHMEIAGPTEVDRSVTDLLIEHDEASDATYTLTENFTQDAEDPEGVTDSTEYYQIGNDTCTISGDSADWESMTTIEREVTDLMTSAVDFNPPIESPTLVGEEQFSGVASEHYQFEVSGLGDSGAEVIRSDGEYWLAVDGRYLVRYLLNLELRDAPEGSEGAQALNSTTTIELTDINAPVSVSFPQACLDAQAEAGAE